MRAGILGLRRARRQEQSVNLTVNTDRTFSCESAILEWKVVVEAGQERPVK